MNPILPTFNKGVSFSSRHCQPQDYLLNPLAPQYNKILSHFLLLDFRLGYRVHYWDLDSRMIMLGSGQGSPIQKATNTLLNNNIKHCSTGKKTNLNWA